MTSSPNRIVQMSIRMRILPFDGSYFCADSQEGGLFTGAEERWRTGTGARVGDPVRTPREEDTYSTALIRNGDCKKLKCLRAA